MVDYNGNMLANISEDITGESATLAAHHLFDVYEHTRKLSQTASEILHPFVAQLLYLSNIERPYIQLAISFL